MKLGAEGAPNYERGFTSVASQEEVDLRRCDACGVHWQVDTGREKLAIRVDEPGRWTDFDDRSIRLGFLVENLGGLGLSQCMWAGCERRALSVSGVCPHHAFPSLSDEVDKSSWPGSGP